MQPRQFLVGQRTAAGAPIPTVAGFVLNVVTGAVLLWLVPRLLPVGTPWAIRFWIALVGFAFLFLIAVRFLGARSSARWASRSRSSGTARSPPRRSAISGEGAGTASFRGACGRLFSSPRCAVPVPGSRSWPCSSTAACTTRSSASWPDRDMADRCSTSCCNASAWRSRIPAGRRLFRRRPWLARAWTFAIVVLPVGLFLHPGLVDGFVVPMLVAGRVPGLERCESVSLDLEMGRSSEGEAPSEPLLGAGSDGASPSRDRPFLPAGSPGGLALPTVFRLVSSGHGLPARVV